MKEILLLLILLNNCSQTESLSEINKNIAEMKRVVCSKEGVECAPEETPKTSSANGEDSKKRPPTP